MNIFLLIFFVFANSQAVGFEGYENELPPHSRIETTSNLRGIWFTSPSDFILAGISVAIDGSIEGQAVEFLRFSSEPTITPTTSFNKNLASSGQGVVTEVDIWISTGDIVGVLGRRGSNVHSIGDYANYFTHQLTGVDNNVIEYHNLYGGSPMTQYSVYTDSSVENIPRIYLYYCPFNCTKCNITNGDCLACETNNYYLSNGKCMYDWCPVGLYKHFTYQEGGYCLDDCPLTYFEDSVNYECAKCETDCEECTSTTRCTKCVNNRYLWDGDCGYSNSCPTGMYAYNDAVLGGICLNCSDYFDNCERCTSSGCYNCEDYYFEQEGECLTGCNWGYYEDTESLGYWECLKCDYSSPPMGYPNCINCSQTEPFECYNCTNLQYLDQNGVCVTECDRDYYFENNDDMFCERCSSGCYRCNSADDCYWCTSLRAEYQGFCHNNCSWIGRGWFIDWDFQSGINKCEECATQWNSYCLDCNMNRCTNCTPYFIMGYTCTDDCSSSPGYYEDLTKNPPECSECPGYPNCIACTSGTECTDCDSYLFNGTCYTDCSVLPGYFSDDNESPPTCSPCGGNCETCYYSGNCSVCDSTFFVLESTCYFDCPEGYFENSATTPKECSNCISPCVKCDSASVCTDCTPQYLLSDECYSSCPYGYYDDDTSSPPACIGCVSPCLDCNSSTVCTNCSPQYLHNGECVADCTSIPGSYVNDDSVNPPVCKLDILCIDLCVDCDDLVSCNDCGNNYLYNDICYNNCSWLSGFYEDDIASPRTCSQCIDIISYCDECESAIKCVNCGNYYLYNDICYNNCSWLSGYYEDDIASPQTCSQCINVISYCDECESADNCVDCGNYYLYNDICHNNCSWLSGYYEDDMASPRTCSQCINVISYCDECESAGKCVDCGMEYLFNDICVTTCQSGYFNDDLLSPLECTECVDPCVECSSDSVCLNCTPQYLHNDECLLNCPVNFYNDDEPDPPVCENCILNCLQCNASSGCQQCFDLHSFSNGACVPDCPDDGKYYYIENDECEECVLGCILCIAGDSCITCDGITYFKMENICVNDCGLGFYPNNNECSECLENCDSCSDDISCTTCANSFYLMNNECLNECGVGFYENNNVCSECSENCNECDDGSTCTECLNSFFLKYSVCVSECGSGFYENNGECSVCGDNCLECDDVDTCSACEDDYEVDDGGSCVSSLNVNDNDVPVAAWLVPVIFVIVILILIITVVICVIICCCLKKSKGQKKKKKEDIELESDVEDSDEENLNKLIEDKSEVKQEKPTIRKSPPPKEDESESSSYSESDESDETESDSDD